MNYLLSETEQEAMRSAGKVLASVLKVLEAKIAPGISTMDLEELALEVIKKQGGEPSFKGYEGYPAALCTSVNNEVVHCIPSKKRILKVGDIVSVDFGVYLDGVHADAARTYPVGKISKEAKMLLKATKASLEKGIAAARPGNHVGDISSAVEEAIKPYGFGIVKKLVGHGIGKNLHMDPQVPNFGHAGTGTKLQAGMAVAIEPMINAGDGDVDIDEWRVTTVDGSLSAHFEDTVLITENGPEIMTRQ